MATQTLWDRLLRAYAQGDWDAIVELASGLLASLDRGDDPPTVLNHPGLDADWQRALARAACELALDTLSARWSLT